MKVNIDGYELEIKAKGFNGKYSKERTLYFLNKLSILYRDAAEHPQNYITKKEMIEYANTLYDILEENHFFDDLR